MADTKITDLSAIAAVAGEDLVAIVDDPSVSPASKKATVTQIATFLNNSPTLVTPALGTPASGVATNITGLPQAGVISLTDDLTSMKNSVEGDLYAKTWTTRTSAQDNGWRSIAWANSLGLFCALSWDGSQRVMTSPDGINWTSRNASQANNWKAITWSEDLTLFCAVSENGTDRVMTSPDGINWTSRSASTANSWQSITWSSSLTLFCAVSTDGTNNQVMTSPDGTNWTTRTTSGSSNYWGDITWSEDLTLFCVVGQSSTKIMTSPDGINWTNRTSPISSALQSVTWSSSLTLFCAVSNSGSDRVITSPDGTTWTSRTVPTQSWLTVTWAPEISLFCALSDTGIMTSPDGINWTTRTTANAVTWYEIVWSPELYMFCAISSSGTGNRVMTSTYSDILNSKATLGANTFTGTTTTASLDVAGNNIDNIQNLIHDTSSGSLTIDFAEDQLQTLTITNHSTFATPSNKAAGKSKTYKLYNSSGSSTYTLAFPSWKFVGAKPTDIAPSKTAILTLTCFGSADTDIVAAYAVEA